MPVPFRELAGAYGNESYLAIYAVSLPLSSQEAENAQAAQALRLGAEEQETGAVAASY